MIVIRFPVNQDQIRLDVAVSVIGTITREWVIKVATGQWRVDDEQIHDLHNGGIKSFSMPA